MSLSGAIPKVQGGARPKIKLDGGARSKQNTRPTLDSKLATTSSSNLPDDFVCVRSNFGLINGERKNTEQTGKCFKLPQSGKSGGPVSAISINDTLEKPLEERQIIKSDGGVQIKRHALHPDWVEKRLYVLYTRPPLPNDDEELFLGAIEAWVEQMEFLIDDLTWLLNLPYYRFWSQMVYDKSVHECLECYLSAGPRWFDEYPQNEICLSMIRDIHQLVFLIYVRMATYKESKNDYITPAVFGELVYNNFLFDICKILDLSALYGSTNKSLLEKMVNNIFNNQPKYYNDLQDLANSLKMVMENVEAKLGIFDFATPLSISSENKFSYEELSDILHYILDTFSSLNTFLSIFPKAAKTFHEKDFEIRLSSFYERVVPTLIDSLTINSVDPEDILWKETLLKQVKVIRLSILSVFRAIFSQTCFQFISVDGERSSDELCSSMETFVRTLTTCVEEKVFITDYNSAYPVDEDVMHYENGGVDMTTLNFVKEAVSSVVAELDLEPEINVTCSDISLQVPKISSAQELSENADDTSGMNGYYAGETCNLSDIEITSLVSSVQDLLPDLGNGFIRACLKYYNYSTEEVLNALLESNLPPCLESLDRSMQHVDIVINGAEDLHSSSKQEMASDLSDVLVNRSNIYDDDEFDIFRSANFNKNKNKVHRGKMNKQYEIDPSLTEKMKEIVHQYEANQGYSIYEEELKYEPIEAQAAYEDEYDDTYDDDDAGVVDNFSTDRRHFDKFTTIKGKGALNVKGVNFNESPEEEDQEEEGIQEGTKGITENAKKANASFKRGYRPQDNGGYRPQDNGGYKPQDNGGYKPHDSGSSFVFTNSNRNRTGNDDESSERSSSEKESFRKTAPTSTFQPFCENPEEIRKRYERMRQNKLFKNKGYTQPRENVHQNRSEDNPQNPKVSSNKNSGKVWRQGMSGDSEEGSRGYRGGKYKEDTNHGKAQDSSHKHKMVHKNEHRRHAAQAKYRNNF